MPSRSSSFLVSPRQGPPSNNQRHPSSPGELTLGQIIPPTSTSIKVRITLVVLRTRVSALSSTVINLTISRMMVSISRSRCRTILHRQITRSTKLFRRWSQLLRDASHSLSRSWACISWYNRTTGFWNNYTILRLTRWTSSTKGRISMTFYPD